MTESNSLPGKLQLSHQVADTLQRTITLSSAGIPLDLTGCSISLTISANEYDNDIIILSLGAGLIASNLAAGEFQISWASAGVLQANRTYYYRLQIFFTDATSKTYLQDKFITR